MKLPMLLDGFRKLLPSHIFILYYAAAILLGTLLLVTPFASTGKSLSLLDAQFIATSAQCASLYNQEQIGILPNLS